jgi:hypothetical protein
MRRQGRSLVVVEREPIPVSGTVRFQDHPASIVPGATGKQTLKRSTAHGEQFVRD